MNQLKNRSPHLVNFISVALILVTSESKNANSFASWIQSGTAIWRDNSSERAPPDVMLKNRLNKARLVLFTCDWFWAVNAKNNSLIKWREKTGHIGDCNSGLWTMPHKPVLFNMKIQLWRILEDFQKDVVSLPWRHFAQCRKFQLTIPELHLRHIRRSRRQQFK